MTMIVTASGTMINPFNPNPKAIRIGDIAHALSHLCRFTGHVSAFYSVAEHSVHCSRLVPPEHAMAALLHDASEAYLGDIAAPLKNRPEFDFYRRAEKWLQGIILRRWTGLYDIPESVHRADEIMLHAEARLILPHSTWWNEALALQGPADLDTFDPKDAYRAFVERFFELLDEPAVAA